MVMISNNGSRTAHELARTHPGKIGWLMGQSNWKVPWKHIPHALDNDAYSAFVNRTLWDEKGWLRMLDKATVCEFKPLWCAVPDVVTNRMATLENWQKYSGEVLSRGFRAAFVVQDGMAADDVPEMASIIFVGGSTSWKWRTVPKWCASFPRVHVGRVRQGKLLVAERCGAESCDGTGWFRESQNGAPIRFLRAWLEGYIKPHPELSFSIKPPESCALR